MIGFLVINKPKSLTSRSALNLVATAIRPAKIGHAGTLDPLATGVLVACVGPATRLVSYVQDMPKRYVAEFRLGVSSESEDIESELIPLENPPIVTRDQLAGVLPQFVGTVSQLPPKFSALKIDGKRAYRLARKGKPVALEPREIEIHDLALSDFDYPNFQIVVECGSGTYIRSLGRDIGKAVGSAAVMTGLVRTHIGKFTTDQAVDLDNLTMEQCQSKLISPLKAVRHLKTVQVDQSQVEAFINGVPLRMGADEPGIQAAIDQHGRLIAIVERKPTGIFGPKINFAHYWLKQYRAS